MSGNQIWENFLSDWGVLIVAIGFIIIVGRHFLSQKSSLGSTLGFAFVWAVLMAIMYNVESLRNFGDSIWSMISGG